MGIAPFNGVDDAFELPNRDLSMVSGRAGIGAKLTEWSIVSSF